MRKMCIKAEIWELSLFFRCLKVINPSKKWNNALFSMLNFSCYFVFLNTFYFTTKIYSRWHLKEVRNTTTLNAFISFWQSIWWQTNSILFHVIPFWNFHLTKNHLLKCFCPKKKTQSVKLLWIKSWNEMEICVHFCRWLELTECRTVFYISFIFRIRVYFLTVFSNTHRAQTLAGHGNQNGNGNETSFVVVFFFKMCKWQLWKNKKALLKFRSI